ncbi:hypothetical protein [Neptuniibacter marinus]|uniref:hypothetical protein n=1 Tax=Neptuniibacter marinus TaxID=1806670 RepID=UPI003B5ADC9A
MKPIRIKPELLELLNSIGRNSFTVSGLVKAYLKKPSSSSLKSRAVAQYVRRNISRLEKKGMIASISGNGDSKGIYQLTQEFNETNYVVGEPHCPENNISSAKQVDLTKELKTKLKQYRIELLTTMGEVEEYDSLSKQALVRPALIQDLYNDARDRCSKTLGKIRALELLLARI